MSPISLPGAPPGLQLVASTPDAGQALIANPPGPIPNGILTWTPPNDGQLHVVWLTAFVLCTSAETGGQLKAFFHAGGNGAGGGYLNSVIQAGGLGTNGNALFFGSFTSDPGQPFFFQQQTALAAGAAICWATLLAL
jgi:hypothetical protein